MSYINIRFQKNTICYVYSRIIILPVRLSLFATTCLIRLPCFTWVTWVTWTLSAVISGNKWLYVQFNEVNYTLLLSHHTEDYWTHHTASFVRNTSAMPGVVPGGGTGSIPHSNQAVPFVTTHSSHQSYLVHRV